MIWLIAAITVLGFAPDDSRVAYIETGVGSGSGEAYAKLHIVETTKGADRVSTFNGDDAEKQALKAAAGALKIFKLSEWIKPKPIKVVNGKELDTARDEPVGNVLVKTARAKGGESCDQAFEQRTVDALLYQTDDDKPHPLGPARAACRGDCSVDSVYASHHKAALVLVKCSVPGFEGKGEAITPFARALTYGLDEDVPTGK